MDAMPCISNIGKHRQERKKEGSEGGREGRGRGSLLLYSEYAMHCTVRVFLCMLS
jgi:hypothetical protein